MEEPGLDNSCPQSCDEDKPFSLSLSVDMPIYAEKTRQFLDKVYRNALKLNCEPAVFNFYIDKYRNFLSLKAKHPDKEILPSLEIEWVWYCHVIRPKFYHAYCKVNFGKIIDHTIDDWIKGDQHPETLNFTAELYEQVFHEPYLYHELPVLKSTEIKYLETADIYNDWTWYDRILTYEGYPGQNDGTGSEFMTTAHEGYLNFLKSVSMKGFQFGPPINIDLFWHTHQLFPLLYLQDCDTMFGKTIYHTPLGTVARWTEFTSNLTEGE